MALLTQRNFLPLFIAQVLGVFNDNVFKSAMTMLVTYKLAAVAGYNAGVLVTLGGAIFILPYALFSGIAGQVADKYEKTNIIRWVKLVELLMMLFGLFVLLDEHLWGLFILLFLMGTHSTFFSPVKYGILPQALPKKQLLAANGLFEASTFLAILIGTMYGGVFILQHHGAYIIGFTCSTVAALGLVASYFIPLSPGVEPKLKLSRNVLKESWNIVAQARHGENIMNALICISWFWLMGAVILSLIPVYGAQVLHGNEMTTTFLLSLFSVGIAVGSVLCQKLFKDQVTLAYVPLSALMLSVAGFVMVFGTKFMPAGVGPLRGILDLLAIPTFWPIMVAFVLLAIAGGVFTVPLYAFIQAFGDPSTKSRLIAANNVLNAVFMVAGAVISSILLGVGVSLLGVLAILMAANLVVVVFSCVMLPVKSQQHAFQTFFRACFGTHVIGTQHLKHLPERSLVICNHQSFLDAAIIAAFFPIKLTFAIDVGISRKWWVKPFLNIIKAFPLDTSNPYAIRELIKLSKAGEPIMIFPEGRLTKTGALMKVYDGTAMVALNADATIIPMYIDGAIFSKQTRADNPYRRRWFPRITLTVQKPEKLDVDPALRGRARRVAAGQVLQRLMVDTYFASQPLNHTLFTALMQARVVHGPKHVAVSDINNNSSIGTPLTLGSLVARGLLLGNLLKREGITHTNKLNSVGLMLPNANAAAATFFALQAVHSVPAMLNFSAGHDAVLSACKAALITNVITAHAFIEKAKLEPLVAHLEKNGITMLYLEDIRSKITLGDKLRLIVATRKPEWFYKEEKNEPHKPAAILFTSGSEGKPKGVLLSHINFNANVAQAKAVVDFNPRDTLLNALPMFHSFGLTGGTLLPVLAGVPVFLYPSPLHYRIVPEVAYNFNATIMFGTDTFLTGYARYAHPYDFYRMRYVFAGAEKVRVETRRTWFEKFGIRILEGYGATETSPVLALNTPMAYKYGAVGKLVPGMEYKLEPVPGLDGGNLIVKGPNVMLGYLRDTAPGVIEAPKNGWYETGDVVTVDEFRFITIEGRLKRFAKIGGEMVSLGAVEKLASACWEGSENAVVALPDDRKGEQLILFTTHAKATKDDLRKYSRANGGSELALPRHLHVVDKLPLLATGKINYPALTEEAKKLI